MFYEFSLERHVPAEHLLRSIDRFVELDGVRCQLAPFYSEVGRPSIDRELMIRMLIVGYCFGIRSEPPREHARPSASMSSKFGDELNKKPRMAFGRDGGQQHLCSVRSLELGTSKVITRNVAPRSLPN